LRLGSHECQRTSRYKTENPNRCGHQNEQALGPRAASASEFACHGGQRSSGSAPPHIGR
jgi:hypothetical protein